MDNKEQLTVKTNRAFFLFFAVTTIGSLVWTAFGPYEKTRIIFENNFYFAIILVSIFSGCAIYCLYRFFYTRPIIIFSEAGIWTKKTGNIPWENITSFYSESSKAEYFDSSSFTFKISGQEEAITISTTFLHPGVKEIVSYLKKNNPNEVVKNLGHYTN